MLSDCLYCGKKYYNDGFLFCPLHRMKKKSFLSIILSPLENIVRKLLFLLDKYEHKL